MMPVACQGIPDSDVCEHIGLPSDEKVHRLSRVMCGCLVFPKINLNLLTKSAKSEQVLCLLVQFTWLSV